MARTITLKQKRFADRYLETGNGSQAAKEVYGVTTDQSARAVASQNLTKPVIQEYISERLTREKVDKAHESLLEAVRLDYFVFPKFMSDEEITGHLEAQGLTCLNIRPSERGKLAFFSLPDGAARGKGIELYHKIMGTFAPEKSVTLNVNVEPSKELLEAAEILNEHFKRDGFPGDEPETRALGTQAPTEDGDRPAD